MSQKNLGRFVVSGEKVLRRFLDFSSPFSDELRADGRLGGFLCVTCPEGYPYIIVSIGQPKPAKLDKYLAFSQEKARRLAANPGHHRSWESRNPDNDQFGGAVRCWEEDLIVSFSGLPELLDEVLSALVLFDVGECSEAEIRRLLANNEKATSPNLTYLLAGL